MKYYDMKKKHQEEVNAFPMMFAFSKTQLSEGMARLGVTERTELVRLPAGGFIRKSDRADLEAMFTRHAEEMAAAMEEKAFLVDAIEYELGNHEYCITLDPSETFEALDLSWKNPFHIECFKEARQKYMAAIEEQNTE